MSFADSDSPGSGGFDYLSPEKNRGVKLSHFLTSKTGRKSWNGMLNQSRFLEKQEVFHWIEMLRDVSPGCVDKIVFEGVLGCEFENLSFVMGLADSPDFADWSSAAVYDLLFDFVIATPVFVQEWLEQKEFDMSRDVLALLAKRQDWR